MDTSTTIYSNNHTTTDGHIASANNSHGKGIDVRIVNYITHKDTVYQQYIIHVHVHVRMYLFPPSSRVTGVRFFAALSITIFPT